MKKRTDPRTMPSDRPITGAMNGASKSSHYHQSPLLGEQGQGQHQAGNQTKKEEIKRGGNASGQLFQKAKLLIRALRQDAAFPPSSAGGGQESVQNRKKSVRW